MSKMIPVSRKEKMLKQIVNAIEGKELGNEIADTSQNKWLQKIAQAIHDYDCGVTEIVNKDQAKPFILRNLESGVYVLDGYFKPCEPVTQLVMAQTPLVASVVKTPSMSYIQLFYSVNNSIQYLEITDSTFTLETASLKQSTLKTNNKTIIGAINELYDAIHKTV